MSCPKYQKQLKKNYFTQSHSLTAFNRAPGELINLKFEDLAIGGELASWPLLLAEEMKTNSYFY